MVKARGLVPIESMPDEIEVRDAVEAVYGTDLDWCVERLRRGASVLIECDKQLTQHLYVAIRGRLRAGEGSRKRGCRLVDGRKVEGPGGLVQKTLADLAAAVQEATPETIVVLPHLDVLTTTTRSGLTMEAREAVIWFYENPEAVFLGFKDLHFELPEVMTDLFPARRSFVGCPRDALSRVILRREARKFAVDGFNPYQLYKYVSGLNVLKVRRVLEQFHDHRDFDPAHPETRTRILREIRRMTVVGGMELPQVDFETDIGGYDDVKARLRRDLCDLFARRDQLTDPDEVRALEELLPKGIIFSGPPGTGKTYFAKALATWLDATLQVVSGPELKSKWVGESEANLRRIFHQARESAPAILVFDELDSFATRRGMYTASGVEHSMVNQLLTEMDGFHKEELVLVIGTTNFVEALDPALLRPGRFELQIQIPYPDDGDRRKILAVHARKFGLDLPEELLQTLARKTAGFVDRSQGIRFSGDHLFAVCRRLKREQIRKGAHPITEAEAVEALAREGAEDVVLNADEERVVASHEAGHALVAALVPGAQFPEKIVIQPDEAMALGYVIREVKKNRYVTSRSELEATLAMGLGGRCAEELLIGEIGVGAYDDLRKATELASMMVETLGMSDLGVAVYWTQTGPGEASRRAVSPETQKRIDDEVARILDAAYRKARTVLSENLEVLKKIVAVLLEKKTLDGKQFRSLLAEAGIGQDHPEAQVRPAHG